MAHSKTREKILVNTEATVTLLSNSQQKAQKFLGFFSLCSLKKSVSLVVQAPQMLQDESRQIFVVDERF